MRRIRRRRFGGARRRDAGRALARRGARRRRRLGAARRLRLNATNLRVAAFWAADLAIGLVLFAVVRAVLARVRLRADCALGRDGFTSNNR